jgi:large subunit ribosomal protein L29
MKMSDIRKMTADDLAKNEMNLREEISKLSFQHRIRPLENTSSVSKLRRDIARMQTLQSELKLNS